MNFFKPDPGKKALKRLVDAIGVRDLAEARAAIAAGAPVDGMAGSKEQPPLYMAALGGYEPMVKLLLDSNAQVDIRYKFNKWTPLMGAAYNGHEGIATLLLAGGADPELLDGKKRNAYGWAKERGMEKIIRLLKKPAAPVTGSTDEITLVRALGDHTLQEIFNFRSRERISLIRETPDGPIEAMSRESFSSIDDKAALKNAYDEYARKGGKIAEDEVFLSKPAKQAGGLNP